LNNYANIFIRNFPSQADKHWRFTMKTNDSIDARAIRRKLGLNQQQFWSQLGVTQSGGSRYESGRNMPRPVAHLLRLVYVENIDITKVRKDDFEVIEFLKANNSALLKDLKKQAKAAAKK
jgi:DNA-binding transcriptional regulator YiaG